MSLTAALCALALVPAAAMAGLLDEERSLALSISLGQSHGYDLELTTAGHHQVTMVASGKLGAATYKVAGEVSNHRIVADFGTLGKVDVRFRGHPRPAEAFLAEYFELKCVGRQPQREVGQFHGTIRFSEPNGFAATEATTAPGELNRTYRRDCHIAPVKAHGHRGKKRANPLATVARRSDSDSGELVTNALIASREEAGRTTSLEALEFEGSGIAAEIASLFGDLIGASARENVGRVAIKRSTFQFAELNAFNVSPPGKLPERAKVIPEKPFLGSAVFEHQPGTPPTWSGELSARLPGIGMVSLTEPGYVATLCRIKGKISESACLRRASPEPLLGSGQRLPVPGLLGRERLLAEVALELR